MSSQRVFIEQRRGEEDSNMAFDCQIIIYLSIITSSYMYSRERNREHARNTRMRKKNHVDSMVMRLEELRNEVCP
jgi:hypothetical protein